MRLFTSTNAPVIVKVSDTAYINPATAIQNILSNPDWGCGGSVNAASFTACAAAFTTAGLGSAVSGVLGGAHEQRRALDVINELASFRGMRIWKDADTGAWMGTVDVQPSASVATLSYGGDYGGTPSPNNVRSVQSVYTTPLNNAVSVLKLQYGKSWRDRGDRNIEEVPYFYTNTTTVLGVGSTRVITNPWLTDHLAAARVAYYIAKRLQREDRLVVIEMGNEARRLSLGDVVTLDLQVTPSTRLTGDYRIIQMERTLTAFTLTCAGPYNADIYATDTGTISAAVNQPSGDINPDERGTRPGNDANLLFNPDWTTGLTKSTWDLTADNDLIPEWYVQFGSGISTITVTTSPTTKGGAYLTIVTAGTLLSNLVLGTLRNIGVSGSTNYLLSIYANRSGDWTMSYEWFNISGTSLGTGTFKTRINPGDVTGSGWARYYAAMTSPATAAYVSFALNLSLTNTTYIFAAAQFEEVTRVTIRPSPWKPNAAYGIHPSRFTAGTASFRTVGKNDLKTTLSLQGTAAYTLSGGTVTVGTVSAGIITGFTGRVVSPVTGATSWAIQLNHGGGTTTTVLSGLGTAVGTFTTDSETAGLTFPIHVTTATPLIAVPGSGTAFTGGTVIVSSHAMTHAAAEA
jgi:hypothetical protein